MKKVFVILLLCLLPGLAWGATYTVCTSGCDETTIQGVINNHDLSSGDNIIECRADSPGGTRTFTLSSELNLGSGADNGIVGHPNILRGRSGDTIILDGQNTAVYIIRFNNTCYWTISNLTFRNPYLSSIGGYNGTHNTGITIDHCDFERTIPSGNTDTHDYGIYIGTQPEPDTRHFDYLLIEDCNFTGHLAGGLWLSDGIGMIVRRCVIDSCGSIGNTHSMLYINDNVPAFYIEEVRVENCIGGSFAIKTSGGANGTFNKCQIIDCDTNGDMEVQHNIGVGDYVNVYNCYFHHTTPTLDTGKYAFYSAITADVKLYNCTFTGNYYYCALYLYTTQDRVRTFDIKNCLINVNATGAIFADTVYTQITSEYNDWHGTWSNNFARINASTWVPYTTWQTTYGHDNTGHSITSDPLLSSDYILNATSPCINTGATLADVTTDIRGVTRPQGSAYEIGAYEFISATMQGCVFSGGVLY